MKENFLSDFTAYIRGLAEQHPDIKHTEDTPHFFRGEIDEFWNGLRSTINYPCVILEGNEIEYNTDDSRCFKTRKTSFMIVSNYLNDDDYDAIDNEFSRCEEIGEDFLGKMLHDSLEGSALLLNFSIGKAVPIQNEQNRYVGYHFDIEFESCSNLYNPNMWNK